MNDYEMYNAIRDIIQLVLTVQVILIVAFILQFVANLVIIGHIPKIRKYVQRIFEKEYNFEENQETKNNYNWKYVRNEEPINEEEIEINEESEEITLKQAIEYIILGILIVAIITIMIVLY